MDIQREFAARPPREELTSLAALVRDWTWRTEEQTLTRDPVMDWCREARSWREAVWRACRSRGSNGKMHNHQSKVREVNRQRLAIRIQTQLSPQWDDFDKLHDAIDALKPSGIGPVTVYDVAVRIGAYLFIEPQSLYLHAGVREGWNALVGGQTRGNVSWQRVGRDMWPQELQQLPADEVEDFLCTYRSIFATL